MRSARTLGCARPKRNPLPTLLFFTDPDRTPHPETVIARLPRGAAVVCRTFGRPREIARAPFLRALARRRGVLFLVGADIGLALQLRADGVHLPQRLARRAASLRRLRPDWIVTAAAHDLPSLIAARRAGAQAAVLSAVFPSASPSAGSPLGPVRFALLVRAGGLPAYALGGVDARTARRLTHTGAIGLAAVDAFSRS